MTVILQRTDFKPDDVIARHLNTSARTGAVVSFIGLVRQNDDGSLQAMTLEHYPEMARNTLEQLGLSARKKFELTDLVVLHRYGRLEPDDRIMMVATASPHRTEAFAAAEFLMDFLKTDAPFWKKEEREDAGTWVDANNSDVQKRGAWLR